MFPRVLLLKNPDAPLSHDSLEIRYCQALTTTPLPSSLSAYLESPRFSQCRGLIFTSKRAVLALAFSKVTLSDKLLSLPVYGVGPKTTAELERIGFTSIHGGKSAGSAEALAHVILNSPPPGNGDLAFFHGNLSLEILPRLLKTAGISIHPVLAYQVTPRTDLMFEEELSMNWNWANWCVFFSPSGVEAVFSGLERLGLNKEKKFAAIGQTTAEALKAQQVEVKLIPSYPLVEEILSGIIIMAEQEEQEEREELKLKKMQLL